MALLFHPAVFAFGLGRLSLSGSRLGGRRQSDEAAKKK
jgi:hypothetical protein